MNLVVDGNQIIEEATPMTTNRIDHELRNWDAPTQNMVAERQEAAVAFAEYREGEESKKFKVRDAFGFSRYSTLEEAEAFAATLEGAEVIAL